PTSISLGLISNPTLLNPCWRSSSVNTPEPQPRSATRAPRGRPLSRTNAAMIRSFACGVNTSYASCSACASKNAISLFLSCACSVAIGADLEHARLGQGRDQFAPEAFGLELRGKLVGNVPGKDDCAIRLL